MGVNAAPITAPLKSLSPAQAAWRWRVMLATYIGYGGFYLTRKTFTICKTTIAKDLGWELGDTAHIWTAFLVAYMIGTFLNSFIGRRWGPRVLLLGGLGLFDRVQRHIRVCQLIRHVPGLHVLQWPGAGRRLAWQRRVGVRVAAPG